MASGASGAELANIINEGALRAVRSNRTFVTEADLEESVEVVIAGYQKKNAVLSDKEKKTVAYHEVGHALVAALQSHSAPVQKITIIPRTSGALGYTMQVEQADKYLMTKEEIENKIATLTGGRAAEEVFLGHVSSGALNDLERVTKRAYGMVAYLGMSDELSNLCYYNNQDYQFQRPYSETTAKIMDDEVLKMINEEYARAKDILTPVSYTHLTLPTT